MLLSILYGCSTHNNQLRGYERYQYIEVIAIIDKAKSTPGILTVEFMTKYNNIWHGKLANSMVQSKMSFCAHAQVVGDVRCFAYLDYAILSIGDGQMEMNKKMIRMHTDRIKDAIDAVIIFSNFCSQNPIQNMNMAERFYKLATVISSSKHLPQKSDEFVKAMSILASTYDSRITELYPDVEPSIPAPNVYEEYIF